MIGFGEERLRWRPNARAGSRGGAAADVTEDMISRLKFFCSLPGVPLLGSRHRWTRQWPLLIRLLLAGSLALTASSVTAATPSTELPDDLTPVYVIQGEGASSPLSARRVTTFGLVSGVQSNGFYLQDPSGDDNPETSDGIFVYTSSAPRVETGACIVVHGGEVAEYYEKTELTTPRRLETLPAEICGSLTAAAVAPLPVPNVEPELRLERFEGMLVAFSELQGVVQGPTKHFSNGNVEIALVADRSLPYVHGGRVLRSNPSDAAGLIFLGNGLGAQLPQVGWGDRVRVRAAQPGEPLQAVVDYSFGKYLLLLLPGQEIEVLSRRAAQEHPAQPDTGAFRVCSFNVLALGRGFDQLPDEAEYEAALQQRATAISEGLQNCEIIGLQETGKPEDAENLARVLSEVSGLRYRALAFAGPGTASPDFPLTNSLLVRDDRVTVVQAQTEQACSRFSFSVRLVPGQCPARLLPLFSRPPLVADLIVSGPWGEAYPLTVIVNHWRSKRGDESVNVVHRKLQAEHVAALVQGRLDADPGAHVVVLGDLNDFEDSGPVLALQNGTQPPLVHAFDALPPLDRYTYIFNGASQVLDHLLLTMGMMPHFGGVDIVHINADYPIAQEPGEMTLYGSSDHDPLALTVRPEGAAWIAGNAHLPNAAVELVDDGGAVVARTHSDVLGDFRFFDLRPGAYMLRLGPHALDTQAPPALRVQVEPGRAAIVELPVHDRRADAGAAGALFSIFYGLAAAD